MHKALKLIKKKSLPLFMISFLLLWSFSPYLLSRQYAQAAVLTEASIQLGRMGASVANNTTTARILIVVKPASSDTEARVTVTYPTSSAFTVDATETNHTVSTTGLPANYQGESLTAWPGVAVDADSVSGGAVTFPSTTLTAGTLYGFYHTGGITNPSAANEYIITIDTETVTPTVIDTQDVAVDIVSATGDQVTVTANIDPTFSFNIQDTALALGTLTSGAVANDGMTTPIDVDTNAGNGYVAFIRSEGTEFQLDSASTGDLITRADSASLETCAAGTECYVIDVAAGTATVPAEYDGNGTTTGGVPSATDNLYEEIATYTVGPIDSDTITITAIAAISVTTQAADDYTDTLEIVGAGNF